MPLQPHCPPSFCLISPEAVLLTGKTIVQGINSVIKPKTKAGNGLTEKRARVYGGNDGLAFAMCEARKRR
ncbi:MAG TPA: hypothetical protein VK671_13975 [Mucilaginibacter sp.]|nr:hypothetical protein [Mucilaginibacter sp.]